MYMYLSFGNHNIYVKHVLIMFNFSRNGMVETYFFGVPCDNVRSFKQDNVSVYKIYCCYKSEELTIYDHFQYSQV